jgi:predicted alpha/beta-hydrolase family hydrolase
MSAETMTFLGASGASLAGVLHRPDGTPRGSVLLAHCFTCSKDLHTMTRLSRGLAGAGYGVLRFDFTGLGESGGDAEAEARCRDSATGKAGRGRLSGPRSTSTRGRRGA